MVARTWIGGGNNKASNPNDWSPTGVPAPGDTLAMTNGTMNIQGSDLASPAIGSLFTSGDPTINLSNAFVGPQILVNGNGDNATLNLKGIDFLYTQSTIDSATDSVTLNLGRNALWIGGFEVGSPDSLIVNGGGTFVNIGGSISARAVGAESLIVGGSAVINANVVGQGGFEIDRFKTETGRLEFGGSVGARQTVTLSRYNLGTLQIDHPTEFWGLVNIAGTGQNEIPSADGGDIDLIGLARADSYSYMNDMLSIFGAGKILDTLRLTSSSAFNVEKTAVGVSIYTPGDTNHPAGTLLPLHS